jgi:teichuronic acid biosynthesis glycosyltransferase TuaC
MKVLTICSGNSGKISPFILDQVDSLRKLGVKIEIFTIQGKGILGYLKNFSSLKKKINDFEPDLIHAHYGFSGLLSSLQMKVPSITTYHGSDINKFINVPFSFLASKLSNNNIFVNKDLPDKIMYNKYRNIIPCGVDLNIFKPKNKKYCREKFHLKDNRKYALFSSAFDNKVKNYQLAKKSVSILDEKVEILELKDYTRDEVNLLINAVDFIFVTSFSETGPLIVKEALACNTPVISVDVGDVRKVIKGIPNCYITSFDPEDIASTIKKIDYNCLIDGRDQIRKLKLDSQSISREVLKVYELTIRQN